MVRNRLYCDLVGSKSHVQAQFTLNVIGTGLIKLLAPILPHLSTECVQYHPLLKEHLNNALQHLLNFPEIPRELLNSTEDAEQAIKFTQMLKSELDKRITKKLDYPKTVTVFLVIISTFFYLGSSN